MSDRSALREPDSVADDDADNDAGADDDSADADGPPEEGPLEADDGFEIDCALGPAGRGGAVVRYDGADWIVGAPTRDELVAECDDGKLSANLRKHMEGAKPVFFMPSDVEESNEYRNGFPTYTMRIYGALMDGSKADVTVTGIEVFFDVAVPDDEGGEWAGPPGRAAFDAHLRHIIGDAGVAGATYRAVEGFPSRGYSVAAKPYVRVSTANLQQRKKAVAAVRAAGLATASDDRTCYYRKAAREHGLPLSDWAVLGGYEYAAGPTAASPLCASVFRVPVESYRPFADTMASKERREAAAQSRAKAPLLARDRTLVVTWDIETHSDRGTGDVPDGAQAADNCFMICMTAHWKDDARPLRQICIVDVETAPDPAWTTVVCGTPENVLRAFALCWRALAPDIQLGFNDSGYDWPFVVEKARRLDLLGWMFGQMTAAPRRATTDESVLQWNYQRDKKVKISAEEVLYCSYLKVPGCVPVDVRVCFKKLYPKSEAPKASSLKFYLEVSGLGGKADMPIKRMWRYYEAARETEGEPDAECAEHMRQVAHYCVVDALRCQQLLVRRNVINDYREVSALAFVSLADSHLYAGGMKVCNLLGAYAWRRNILTSMIPLENAESGKYPGAYVFPPKKGLIPDPGRLAAVDAAAAAVRAAGAADDPLAAKDALAADDSLAAKDALAAAKDALAAALAAFNQDRPVTGLDFASLYPSLIMTYNLSPEKILLTAAEAAHWAAQGRRLHPIEFPFNGRTVVGWSVLHGNRPEELGLYPSVLIDLFAKRAEVKVSLGAHGAVKELLEVAFGRAKRDGVPVAEALRRAHAEGLAERARTEAALAPGAPPPRLSPGSTVAEEVAELRRLGRNAAEQVAGVERVLALAGGAAAADAEVERAARAEHDRACFDWTCANTKQNALKVYMNTFYGEAGNSLSAYFLLQLAGGVTSAGQHSIKLVADFVRGRGFDIKYGDTDSLYLSAPGRYFEECDAAYAGGRLTREEWYSAMVRITMRALNQLRDEVNAHLRADNGCPYLKMAYEEVLYPVVFTGKKKYFGVPHLNEVNFRPEKLFIRGIDVVKQGQPGLAREIGHRIMRDCMALDNGRAVRRIVEDALRDAVLNGAQWNFAHFVKTDAWKPHKNNVPVQRFVARMRGRHAIEVAENARAVAAGGAPRPYRYELPEAGERFSYVIVKTGASFDLYGRKSAPKKGDRMEFAKVALELALEVDVAFYMVSYVVGLCARFINGDPEFQPPPGAHLDEKKIDEAAQKAAKKALDTLVKGLSDLDSGMLKRRGYAYRRAFTQAAAGARGALVARLGAGAAEVLHGEWLDFEVLGGAGGAGDDEDPGAIIAADGEEPVARVEAADGATRVVEAAWASAGARAGAIVAAGGAAWCEGLGRALGIAADGGDVVAVGGAGADAARPAAANLFRATAVRRRPAVTCVAQIQAGFHTRREAETRAALALLAPGVADVAVRYEAGLSRLVFRRRQDEHATHPEIGAGDPAPEPGDAADILLGVAEEDRECLLEFRRVWYSAVGLLLVRRRAAAYADYLRRLKDRRLGVAAAPTRAERERSIAAAAAKLRPSGDIAGAF
jgi:DNA polymerase elongation subunit (family B)